MRITDGMAIRLITELSSRTKVPLEAFHYEIQDDWASVLVTVRGLNEKSKEDLHTFLELAQAIASHVVPSDEGRYTWTICVVDDANVVDAVFGGDRRNPFAGYV